MKNLKLLFMLLFGLLCPSAFAQSGFDFDLDESRPLITDVGQLSSPYNAPHDWEGNLEHLIDGDPMTYWHTNWNDKSGDLHYVQIALAEPFDELVSMKFTRRKFRYNSTDLSTTDHVTRWGIYGSDNPDAEISEWMKLGEFDAPYGEPGETMNTVGFQLQGKQYIRVYGLATNNNPNGSFWHVAELQFYPCQKADEVTSAMRELVEVYLLYVSYIEPFQENVGTAPGQYSAEAVAAFIDVMDKASEMDGRTDVTAEEIRALTESIKTTYQAVLDSAVPFTLADGYYRLRHAVMFLNNIPTGEVDEEGNAITEQREVNKYMYSMLKGDKIVVRWNTPANLETDCPSLWKVTNKDGLYDIVNCATDARFDQWVSSNSVLTMSKDSKNLIAADFVENYNGDPCVALRVSTQNTSSYFHPIGHGIPRGGGYGTGVENDIIGWANDDSKVSEWVFVPVDDEIAEACIEAYKPYKDHDLMVESFKLIREDAEKKIEIARDLSYSQPLITSVNQLSSPWSAPHDWEGNIGHMLDGDPLTYWHTNWNNNTDRHYVQIELNEPVYDLICMKFTRRLYNYNQKDICTTNHVTEWSFYGSDDPDAAEEDWEMIAEIETPYNEAGETIITEGFNPEGKKYLRLYGETNITGNRCWHLAELQLYPSPMEVIDPATSQYHMMGSVATTLDAVLAELKDVEADQVTAEQYSKLKSAYDAFIALFVDPLPLRSKIEAVKNAGDIVEIGNQPGFWKDNSACENLNSTIEAAKAYDTAGVYTTENSEAMIQALEDAANNIKKSAIQVQPGKWYRIRFGTEEEYAEHKWNGAGNETQYRTVDGEATDVVINESSFGKYMTVARLVREQDEDEFGSYTQNIIECVDKADVHIGDQLYFDAAEDIEDADMALFRFISVGDSAYIIQNKATGLYLQKKAESNNGIYLSVHPSFFAQEIVGYGQNAFFIRTLSNEAQNPLHFARNTNVVITYGSYGDSDGRRGCFYVEEAGNVADDYAANTARISMWEGAMMGCCYPVSMKAVDKNQGVMWTVASIERNEENNTLNVRLAEVCGQESVAGRPFIYVADGEFAEERDESMEPELIEFTFGNDIVAEPVNDGLLKGVFTRTTIGAGVMTIGETKLDKSTSTSTAINTDEAYIAEEEAFPREYKVEVIFDENAEDGVTAVLQKVSRTGAIYTIDGRLVSKSGNLNSLKNAKPGIYIVNGIKVVVK